jgi:hypothetical protein
MDKKLGNLKLIFNMTLETPLETLNAEKCSKMQLLQFAKH